MNDTPSGSFRTRKRQLQDGDELSWGEGNETNNESWSEAIETSSGTTVTETGIVKSGSVIPDSVIDHFEESLYEDQEKTLNDYYTGDTSVISRNKDTPVAQGNYSLKKSNSNTGGVIISQTGLNRYPSKGDVFRTSHYVSSSSGAYRNSTVIFGAQDTNNYYEVKVAPSEDTFYNWAGFSITKKSGGDRTTLQRSLPGMSDDKWYTVEIKWHDGSGSKSDNTIVATLIENGAEASSLTASDSEFSDETGFGWALVNESSSLCVADNARRIGNV